MQIHNDRKQWQIIQSISQSLAPLLVVFMLLLLPASIMAQDGNPAACEAQLQSPRAKILSWIDSNGPSDRIMTYQRYERLLTLRQDLGQLLPPDEVLSVIADEEMFYYAQTLSDLLIQLEQDPNLGIQEAVKANLQNRVPANSIENRAHALVNRNGVDWFKRALGDMTLQEVQLLVHGGHPQNPTPDSLLGKYIAETGARTVIRGFPMGPPQGADANNLPGAPRLVVAVSEQSFDIYLKYFKRIEFLIHRHEPGQGTLALAHNGKTGTYGNHQYDFRRPSIGSIMPHLLVKTTEAQRLSNYFKLAASQQHGGHAKTPWILTNAAQRTAYCAVGGYASCTHWVGNIPMGDKIVDAYIFPGKVDQHAYNSVSNDPDIDKLPRFQQLKPYDLDDPLTRMVWKVPGNQQLAFAIGLGESQIRGELANPGWVAISLTAKASVDRVPVVFYSVENHQAEIDPNFNTGISAQ